MSGPRWVGDICLEPKINPRQPDAVIAGINAACDGHPFAKIPWPHRILHEARETIEAQSAEITRLRTLGVLCIGNLRISLGDDLGMIVIDRDGEGGHFSMREFHDLIQEFVSDRL